MKTLEMLQKLIENPKRIAMGYRDLYCGEANLKVKMIDGCVAYIYAEEEMVDGHMVYVDTKQPIILNISFLERYWEIIEPEKVNTSIALKVFANNGIIQSCYNNAIFCNIAHDCNNDCNGAIFCTKCSECFVHTKKHYYDIPNGKCSEELENITIDQFNNKWIIL